MEHDYCIYRLFLIVEILEEVEVALPEEAGGHLEDLLVEVEDEHDRDAAHVEAVLIVMLAVWGCHDFEAAASRCRPCG